MIMIYKAFTVKIRKLIHENIIWFHWPY